MKLNGVRIGFNGNAETKTQQENTVKSPLTEIKPNQTISSESSNALKSTALAGININTNYKVEEFGVRVSDLFNTRDSKFDILPKPKIGVKRLSIEKQTSGKDENVAVRDDKTGRLILEATKNKGFEFAKIGFTDGKAGPTGVLVLKDPKTNKNYRILMRQGSIIKTKDFTVKMPGTVEMPNGKSSEISFAGSKFGAMLAFKPEKSVEAFQKYSENNLQENIQKGEHADELSPDDFHNVFAVGGFGSRFGAVLDGGDNKPSVQDPSVPGHTLLAYAMDSAVGAGVLDGKDMNLKKDLNISIEDDPEVGNAGGFIQYLDLLEKQNGGPIDKPIIVWPGDGISDIDYSKPLKFFKDTPDAGAMIISIPLNEDQIEPFGIVGVDEKNHVTQFVEKPKTHEDKALAKLGRTADGKYLANIAVYVLKPEVVKQIKDIYKERQEDGKIDMDFGADVLPALKDLCAGGKIKDKDGNPLKMYAIGAKGDWSDVGAIQPFIDTSRTIAQGDKYKNLSPVLKEGYKKNVDAETGVVYMPNTREALNKLLPENSEIKGNILVMDA